MSPLTKTDQDDWTFDEPKPRWRCEECGAEDLSKPLPADRAKFYARGAQPHSCPKCGSKALMPAGW